MNAETKISEAEQAPEAGQAETSEPQNPRWSEHQAKIEASSSAAVATAKRSDADQAVRFVNAGLTLPETEETP